MPPKVELTVRRFEEGDLAAIVELWNENVRRASGKTTEGEIDLQGAKRMILDHPEYDPDGHFVAYSRNKLLGRISCGGPSDKLLWFGIMLREDEPLRAEVAEKLLARLRQRARKRSMTEIQTMSASALLLSHGFRVVKREYSMSADLSGPAPRREPPAGYVFRPIRIPAEKLTLTTFLNDAMGSADGRQFTSGDIDQWVRLPTFDEGGFILSFGEPDRELVGVSLNVIKPSSPERGYVLVVAVGSGHRGRGLGHSLLGQGLHWLRRKGAVVADLHVEAQNGAALKLYEDLGFHKVTETALLRCQV